MNGTKSQEIDPRIYRNLGMQKLLLIIDKVWKNGVKIIGKTFKKYLPKNKFQMNWGFKSKRLNHIRNENKIHHYSKTETVSKD